MLIVRKYHLKQGILLRGTVFRRCFEYMPKKLYDLRKKQLTKLKEAKKKWLSANFSKKIF